MFKLLQPIRGYVGVSVAKSFLNSIHLNRCCYSTTYTKTSNKRVTKRIYNLKEISDPQSKKSNVTQINQSRPPPPPPSTTITITTTPTTTVALTNITKQDTLNYFTRLSDRLLAEFTRYPYITSLKHINKELFRQNRDQETFVTLTKSIRQNSDFIQSVTYMNRNLAEYTPKEKAILFKMLTMFMSRYGNETSVSQSDASLQLVRNALLSLEIDYYTLNLSEDLNLVDMINYRDGFYCYRDRTLHYVQVSTECLYDKLVETVEGYFHEQKYHQQTSNEKETQSSSPTTLPTSEPDFVNDLNRKWQLEPFNSNMFYMGLKLHSNISNILSPSSRVNLFSNIYKNSFLQITNMDLISKLLCLYFDDRFMIIRPNNNYTRLLYENIFKMFKNVSSDQEPSYSDMYEKSKVIRLLLDQTTNFEKESVESKNYLNQYKKDLIAYFVYRANHASKVQDYNGAIGCLSRLIKSLTTNEKLKITNQEFILENFFKRHLASFKQKQISPIAVDNDNNNNNNVMKTKENLFRNDNFFEFDSMFRGEKLISDTSDYKQLGITFTNLSPFYNWNACNSLNRFASSCQNLVNIIRNNTRTLASKLAANFERAQLTPDRLNDMNRITISEKTITNNNPLFKLEQNTLDIIYKIYAETMSTNDETQSKNEILIPCINLLLAHQYYSEERLKELFEHVNDLVEKDINNVNFFFNSILKNENFYESTLPDETSEFFGLFFNKVKSLLVNNETFSDLPSNLSNSLVRLIRKFNSNLSNRSGSTDTFESITIDEYNMFKKKFENIVDSIVESKAQNDENTNEPPMVKSQVESSITALKTMAHVLMLTDKKCNEDLLIDFVELVTNFLGKLAQMKLLVQDNKTNQETNDKNLNESLTLEKTLDVLTIFGFFNVYDIDALTKDTTKLFKLRELRKKLNSLNKTAFDLVQQNYANTNELDHYGLIFYNMCLINMGIESNDAILEMFKRVSSVEDLKKQFDDRSESRNKLYFRMYFTINQELNVFHKHLNPLWLFEQYVPTSEDDTTTHMNICEVIDKRLIAINPVYKFNLTAHKDYFKCSSNEHLKKTLSSHVKRLKSLYPVAVAKNEKITYLKKQIIEALEGYASTNY